MGLAGTRNSSALVPPWEKPETGNTRRDNRSKKDKEYNRNQLKEAKILPEHCKLALFLFVQPRKKAGG